MFRVHCRCPHTSNTAQNYRKLQRAQAALPQIWLAGISVAKVRQLLLSVGGQSNSARLILAFVTSEKQSSGGELLVYSLKDVLSGMHVSQVTHNVLSCSKFAC